MFFNFFRDGYDGSTMGGYLIAVNDAFTGCVKTEKSGILIKKEGLPMLN